MDNESASARYEKEDIMYLHHRRTARRYLSTPTDFSDEDENAYNAEVEINELFWNDEILQNILDTDEDTVIEDLSEESDDIEEEEAPPVKRKRITVPRKGPRTSRWWHDLQRVREPDCPKYFRRRWLRRFRLPIDVFDSLVSLCAQTCIRPT